VSRALLAGATGLIGSQLLNRLLESERYSSVITLSRKPLSLQHKKLRNIIINFDQLAEVSPSLAADDIYCCLGTTMKQAGSKEAFMKVDHDYPLALAKLTKALSAKQYLLVSAIGANKDSSIFYNKVKGEVEEDISSVGFNAFHIFRPSLLMGPRSDKRPGEEAAKFLDKYFGFLIPSKYKGIDSKKVANAMLHFAGLEQSGVHIHESKSLQKF
jgi:uncharacterized protein YbjT (DUF2867 family)